MAPRCPADSVMSQCSVAGGLVLTGQARDSPQGSPRSRTGGAYGVRRLRTRRRWNHPPTRSRQVVATARASPGGSRWRPSPHEALSRVAPKRSGQSLTTSQRPTIAAMTSPDDGCSESARDAAGPAARTAKPTWYSCTRRPRRCRRGPRLCRSILIGDAMASDRTQRWRLANRCPLRNLLGASPGLLSIQARGLPRGHRPRLARRSKRACNGADRRRQPGVSGLGARAPRLDGFEVVGEAANGASALEPAQQLEPELVLLDVALPDTSGFEVAERLADGPSKVILTSSRERRDFGERVRRAGALGFVPKERLSGAALEALMAGHP